MGASQEKRKRQEIKDGGFAKVSRADEAAAKAKKTKRNTIIVIVVVLVCLAAALFINSKYLRRNGTALKIGDSNVSVSEYNYFFNNTYYDYRSTITQYYGEYADSMLPSTSEPLSTQKYSDTMTWSDYLESLTLSRIVPYYTAYEAAKAAGYELSEKGAESLDNQVVSITAAAATSSFGNVDDYLAAYYGRGMNLDIFSKCSEIALIAGEYGDYYKNSLTYTAEQIEEQKESKGDAYEQYRYRVFLVSSEKVDEADFEDADAYAAALDAAAAAAKVQAQAYCSDIKSEDDFNKAAADYDSEVYGDESSTFYSYLGSELSSTFKDWLTDSARKPGDVTAIEDTAGTYVVYFKEHDANDYNTVDLRAIAIRADSVNSGDYDSTEDYEKAVAEALAAAEEKANALYKAWQDEGASEELFIKYANENSSLSAEDGYLGHLAKESMFEEAKEWAFSPDRKTGDTVVLTSETENASFIFWFAGEDQAYSDYLAESDLRTADYNSWYSGLTKDVEPQKTWLFRLAK